MYVLVSYQIYDLQTWSPWGFTFHFLDGIHWYKVFKFLWSSVFIFFSLLLFVPLVSYLGNHWASKAALMVKNPLANAGDVRDEGLIPGSGRFPGGGHSNPLQYSCLDNPMDRGAWQDTVYGITKSQTWLKQLSMHTCWETIA